MRPAQLEPCLRGDMPDPTGRIAISDHIAGGSLTRIAVRVTLLCCFMLVIEGMDTSCIAFIGPLISKQYGLPTTLMGWIYAASILSSFIGAVGVATLCDQIGRRRPLIVASFVMSAATIVTPLAHSFVALLMLRIVVGVALGAAVPCAFALTADYAPNRNRALMIMVVTCGVALGAVIAGLISAMAVSSFGWPVYVELVGGISLAFSAFMVFTLPESVSFMVRTAPAGAATRRLLDAVAAPADVTGAALPEKLASPTPLELLAGGRAATTLALLFVTLCVYAIQFMLGYWMPTALLHSGASVESASLITASSKLAGIVGSMIVGIYMDRFGQSRMLARSFFVTAALMVALSQAFHFPLLALPVLLLTGFFMDASFCGALAIVSSSYSSEIRGTAIGWITGLGRLIGGSGGTAAGGYLMAAGWTPPNFCLLMAGCMGASTLCILSLGRARGRWREVTPPEQALGMPASAPLKTIPH